MAQPCLEIKKDIRKSYELTRRSDYPNQTNNVLAFPGIFRDTFDVRASDINEEMKMAAVAETARKSGVARI